MLTYYSGMKTAFFFVPKNVNHREEFLPEMAHTCSRLMSREHASSVGDGSSFQLEHLGEDFGPTIKLTARSAVATTSLVARILPVTS